MRWADLEQNQGEEENDENDPWQSYSVDSLDLDDLTKDEVAFPFDLREERERHPRNIKPIYNMICTTWASHAAMAINTWRTPASERICMNLWIHPEGDASKGECRVNRHSQRPQHLPQLRVTAKSVSEYSIYETNGLSPFGSS